MSKPARHHHRMTPAGEALGGMSAGPGFAIKWAGIEAPDGTEPADVLRACASRMKHLQQTNLGSDRNARALFSVLAALDELEQTNEVSHPVPKAQKPKE